jgi:hypothetical protein
MNGYLRRSGSQELDESRPVGGGIRESGSEFLSRGFPTETGAGLEEIVIHDLRFDEGGQADIALESSKGTGATLEVGPLSFQTIVVRLLEEGAVHEVTIGINPEVIEGTDVAPEAVGENLGLLHVGRMMIGHGESVAGGLGVTSGGEIMSEVSVIARDVREPEPPLLAVGLELGFIGQDAGFSPAFLGNNGKLAAFFREEEGGFVTPPGDGVVGDLDLEEIAEGVNDAGCGHGADKGEIEGDGDGGRREFHSVPVEGRLDPALNEADLTGIEDRVEGVFAGEGDVDFVSAAEIPFGSVAIAAKTESITQMFKDAHIGAALGADHLGVFPGFGRTLGDKLASADGILAPVALEAGIGIPAKAMDLSTATGTTDIGRRTRHNMLLSGFWGVNVEKPYDYHNPLTRKELRTQQP